MGHIYTERRPIDSSLRRQPSPLTLTARTNVAADDKQTPTNRALDELLLHDVCQLRESADAAQHSTAMEQQELGRKTEARGSKLQVGSASLSAFACLYVYSPVPSFTGARLISRTLAW